MQPVHAVADHIRHLENERYKAMLEGDIDRLSELLDTDLVYTHSNSQRDGKLDYLAKVASGEFNYQSIDHHDEHILVHDSFAVVVGQMSGVVELAGHSKSLDNSCLAVWVRHGDWWRLLAYQPTVNPPA